jgi:hypothetical protein
MTLLLNLIADVLAVLTRFALFLGIAVAGGIGSAWVMIHSGSRISTAMQGPWVTWSQAGRPDADPYTRAHTVRLGLLPVNPSLALTFHARTDADGNRLHSSCDYVVEIDPLDASWWSLAAFDDSGRVIRNAAQRHAFNTATIVRESDGKATVVLARDARPGNWLPTAGAGNVTLALFVQDQRWAQQSPDEQNKQRPLPGIRKLGCPR